MLRLSLSDMIMLVEALLIAQPEALFGSQPESAPPAITLVDMPNEIMGHILNFVPPDSILSVLFTSKQMYQLATTFHREPESDPKTSKRRGLKVRPIDIKKAQEARAQARHQRGTALVRIEAELLTRLDNIFGLTCCYCARIKHNNRHGFSDHEYHRDNRDRMCIECQAEHDRDTDLKQTIFKVKGIPMFVCYGRCRKATALARQWVFMAGRNNSERRFCKRCWTRFAFGDTEMIDLGTSSYDQEAETASSLVRLFARGWRFREGEWAPFGQDDDYDGDDEAGEEGNGQDEVEEEEE